MGSGVILPSLLSIATSTSEALIIASQTSGLGQVDIESNGPWTPPQYSQPALTIITVPATNSVNGQPATPAASYVFDAVFRLVHNRRVHKTQHPVLTGANISDHAYMEPARLTLEIGMSDAMSSFADGVWVGAATKSVSAWQILKSIAQTKILLTVTTRLDTYYNMLIMDMTAPDDNKTKHALRGTIILEEVIAASVQSQTASSARPQTTGQTSGGTVQSTAPNESQVAKNVIPSTLYPNVPLYSQVPGAGNVSSNSLSQVNA
jgi:hypothetical protein